MIKTNKPADVYKPTAAASLKQMGRDKLESQRERKGEKRERGKQAENWPIIEMASGKKGSGKHRGRDRLGIGRWQRKRMKEGASTEEDVDSERGRWNGVRGDNERKWRQNTRWGSMEGKRHASAEEEKQR